MIYLQTELSVTSEFEARVNEDYNKSFSRKNQVQHLTFQPINEIYLNSVADLDKAKHGNPQKIEVKI